MKKLLIILLAFVMVFSFVACDNATTTEDEETKEPKATTTATVDPTPEPTPTPEPGIEGKVGEISFSVSKKFTQKSNDETGAEFTIEKDEEVVVGFMIQAVPTATGFSEAEIKEIKLNDEETKQALLTQFSFGEADTFSYDVVKLDGVSSLKMNFSATDGTTTYKYVMYVVPAKEGVATILYMTVDDADLPLCENAIASIKIDK